MRYLLILALLAGAAHGQTRLTLADLPTVPAVALSDCTGLVKFKPAVACKPTSIDDLSKIMSFAEEQHRHVKAIGSMHSWSGVQAADDICVLPQGLAFLQGPAQLDDGTLRRGVDPAAEHLVRVGSGMQLWDLNPALWKLGLGLPNMGGYDEQTVGGVMNTATHGSGLAFTPFSDRARSVDMVLAGGKQVRLEPKDGLTDAAAFARVHPQMELIQDDEVFEAAVAGLGTMGIAHSYVLAVRERFHLDEQRTVTTWEALKAGPLASGGIYKLNTSETNPPVPGSRYPAEHVEFAINPYLTHGAHTVLVTTRKDCPEPTDPGFRPGSHNLAYRIKHPEFTRPWFSESLLDVGIVPNAFGSLTREFLEHFPGKAPALLDSTLKTAQDDAFIDRSYFVFVNGGTEKICAYSEEIGVPVAGDAYVRATDALLAKAAELLKTQRWVQTGPISLRFVRRSRSTLAPQPEDTCMFDLIFLKGSTHGKETCKAYEDLLLPFGGRPHFGKYNALTPERTRQLYGAHLTAFNRVRRRLDPHGVMANSQTDRMIGAP